MTLAWPELDEATAYAVQFAGTSAREESVVGFKLGYTSAAMRAQMNIDSPNYGPLFASTRCESDASIPYAELIHPLVEPEIALVLACDVHAAPHSEDVDDIVGSVMPALEIVDTRYDTYAFTAFDNIADLSSASRFVVGAEISSKEAGDLRTIACSLSRNGEVLATGAGADVMGDPRNALAWFLERRIRDGFTISAGTIVLTGGMTAAQVARAGDAFVSTFDRLGHAACRFVA